MRKRLTRRARSMLREALRCFPELQGRDITVGYTRANLGSAVLPRRAGQAAKLTVRLRVRALTYNTIGHELTHLVQALSRLSCLPDGTQGKIPGGEKQCDIWTLARSRLFCDDAPTYLSLPRGVRENWPRYARSVRELCIAAIEKRPTYRLYIRWLETQIKQLVRQPLAKRGDEGQMSLPLDDLLPPL